MDWRKPIEVALALRRRPAENELKGPLRAPRQVIVIRWGRTVLSAAAVLGVVGVPYIQDTRGDTTDEAAVLAALDDGCDAFEKGDAARLERFLDERFTLTTSRGEVTDRSQNLAEVRAREPRYEDFSNHEMKARLYGNTAVVHGITRVKGASAGQPFAAEFAFTDTLVKRDGRWILVTSHASPLKKPTAPPGGTAPSLYSRLGGYDVLAKIVDHSFARVGKDPRFARFKPASAADGKRIRQSAVNFFCERTGGPCFYTGGDLKAVHQGLKIDKELWDADQAYLAEALDAVGVEPAEKAELLKLIAQSRGDVVEAGAP